MELKMRDFLYPRFHRGLFTGNSYGVFFSQHNFRNTIFTITKFH